jgi:hypothetical protein
MVHANARWSGHPLSAAGIVLTTVSATLFLSLWALDAAGWIPNPYVGLLAFIAIPVLFVLGLLLIPIGAWLERRRARRGLDALPRWPRIDFNDLRARRLALVIVLATLVNVLLIVAAGTRAVNYLDSPAFCGSLCHTPMQPQFVQWQHAPHARIACVDCHVGTERGSFVKAKLEGTRRLAHVITATYPQPIAVSLSAIPAAAFTCKQCHSPALFSGDKLIVVRSYADDETNSENTTTLRMHIGMRSRPSNTGSPASTDNPGVHWHADPDRVIEYAATDASEGTIPWVRVTERDGRTRTFVADGTSVNAPPASPRRMDCLGCHSRPAHTFAPSAERAVDGAIADGQLDRSLPYVHRETVRALTLSHAAAGGPSARSSRDGVGTTQAGAAQAAARQAADDIGQTLRGFYAAKYPALAAGRDDRIERTVRAAQELYRQHVFPAMRVTWGTYVSRLGHTDAPGCFRCHDEGHKAADGSVIRQDCTMCHAMEQ